MGRKKRRTAARKAGSGSQQSSPSPSRSLVTVDEEALRARADAKRIRYLKQLETAQRSLQRFEEQDAPSFEQWRAAEFGSELTELREMQSELREIGSLVDEVEDAHFFTGRTYRECYEGIKHAREHPEEYEGQGDPFDEDPGDFDGSDEREPRDPDSFERELLEEFAAMFGFDADSDDAGLREEFERFARKFGFGGEAAQTARKPPSNRVEPELKRLYRSLARKLHPDHRASSDASDAKRLDALWHDTQEAYSVGDLESLERIDALMDIEVHGVTEQTAVERIEQVAERHRQSLRAIERSIRQARKHPAWMFSKKAAARKKTLRAQIGAELDDQLAYAREELAYCRRRIAQWTKPRTTTRKTRQTTASQARSKKPPQSGRAAQARAAAAFGGRENAEHRQMNFSF